MAIVHTGLTLAEFLRQPEVKPAHEYLDGVVTTKMPPKGPHSRLQLLAGMLFEMAAGDPPEFLAFTELRTNWTEHASLVPDVSVYLVDRIPTTPDGDVAEDFWVPPDVALEIASPGQSMNELNDRASTLLRFGVRAVIVVEPRQRRVRIARPGQQIISCQGDDVVTVEDILPGVSFAVSDLFAALQVRRPHTSNESSI